MTDPASLTPLDWDFGPLDLLRAWPSDRPLAALLSAPTGSAWSRWSVFAQPVLGESVRVEPDDAAGANATVQRVLGSPALASAAEGAPPFVGGWIGWLSYDLGRVLEPKASAREGESGAADDRGWPLLVLHRCPAAYLHDSTTGRWHRVGDPALLPAPEFGAPVAPASTGAFDADGSEHAYTAAVREAIELIRAGDMYQANIAHRLSARFEGSARELSARLLAAGAPWYGAHIESADARECLREAVLSVSPELFLRYDAATRRAVTRPIKGTRSAPQGARALAHSEKDRAELAMIVDLMRNDLGRVCETGSVRVDEARAIESHASGGILHGVATVSGTLHRDRTLFDLVRASFPPGSVTGAPKIRAMQVIDALEPVRRGPYCGAVGFISDSGDACFNVAIRTAALRFDPGSTPTAGAGTIDISVGAGIVADSDPNAEWRETLDKAGALVGALNSCPEPARA